MANGDCRRRHRKVSRLLKQPNHLHPPRRLFRLTMRLRKQAHRNRQIEPAEKARKQEAAPYAPEIRRVKLTDGAFHFLDENGKVVARFTGVDFRSSLRSTTALSGTIKIEKTSLRDKFFLEQLQSPLRYDPTVLDFAKVSAKADGGEITGGFSMRPQEEDSPFTARIQFHDLQADRIVTEAGGLKES